MSVRVSDLPGLVGKRVVVEMHNSTDGGLPIEIEGEVKHANSAGLVLVAKNGTIIVEAKDILDIYPTDAPRKIVRRKVRYIPERQARQHLLDRHGMFLDLLKMSTARTAHALHESIDHKNLGHQHMPDEEGG